MQSRRVLTFPGTRDGFVRAFADLRVALDRHRLEQEPRYSSELVFEEVVTNIVKHAYADDREHAIEVALELTDGAIVMRFEDDGVPFDPVHHPPIEHARSILEARTGGRGLSLLRKRAHRLEYERTPNQRNRLTVTIGRT